MDLTLERDAHTFVANRIRAQMRQHGVVERLLFYAHDTIHVCCLMGNSLLLLATVVKFR